MKICDKNNSKRWTWWLKPIMPALGKLRRKNYCELWASLGYRTRSCLKTSMLGIFFVYKQRKAKSLFPVGLHEFFEVPQGQDKAVETDAVQTVASYHSHITQLRDYMSLLPPEAAQPPHSGEEGEMLLYPKACLLQTQP